MADESDLTLFTDYLNACDSTNKQRVRPMLPRINPLEEYDDEKFQERFRLSKATVVRLLSDINKQYLLHSTHYYTLCRQKLLSWLLAHSLVENTPEC